MNEREPNFSRVKRKKGRSNRILNIAIGIVALLIVIVASFIMFGGNGQDDKEIASKTNEDQNEIAEKPAKENDDDKIAVNDSSETNDDGQAADSDDPSAADDDAESADEENRDDDEATSETITHHPSDDAVVSDTIIDTSWEPIGTTQTGEHVSLYDGKSVDWNEKKQALAYATGLPEQSMIFWKIKNGGSPQKSVGIVSTRDKAEKYRVYLEWVDGQGWKPIQMDVLTTLDFDY